MKMTPLALDRSRGDDSEIPVPCLLKLNKTLRSFEPFEGLEMINVCSVKTSNLLTHSPGGLRQRERRG